MRRRVQRGLFALATVAALGFGAAQAFASPATVQAAACTNALCNTWCQSQGYDGGICAGSFGCACWIQ